MSKTDKTKPWRIRVAEHRPTAQHDHSNGICDLPSSPYDPPAGFRARDQHCYWSDNNLNRPGGCCWGCGCRLCTDHWGRRCQRRRERHVAQRETRAVVKGLLD